MKNKGKIYISLPISGYDIEERHDCAMLMEIRLKSLGYDVFNPLGDGWVQGLSNNEYMRKDLISLLDCDAIFFMNGWDKSLGCHTEFCVAVACGIDILFEEKNDIKL